MMKYVSIREVLKSAFTYKRLDNLPAKNNYDNYSLFLFALIEFSLVKNLILKNNLKKVVVNGANDRYCLFVSRVCELNNVHLAYVQHGAFTKFENCQTVYANEFHYMYEFSIPYLKYFFSNPDSLELHKCPSGKSISLIKDFSGNGNINIAYACTPSNIELNFKIIELILKHIGSSINLIVHPHPREDESVYEAKLKAEQNVTITKEKFRNIRFLVTRISSLGVELKEIGIEPVFINLEGHCTDFLDSGNYLSFEDLESFELWLISNLSQLTSNDD